MPLVTRRPVDKRGDRARVEANRVRAAEEGRAERATRAATSRGPEATAPEATAPEATSPARGAMSPAPAAARARGAVLTADPRDLAATRAAAEPVEHRARAVPQDLAETPTMAWDSSSAA